MTRRFLPLALALYVASLSAPTSAAEPSATSVLIAKTRRYVVPFGEVVPAHPGRRVNVSLLKLRGGKWERVAFRRPRLDADGAFETRLERPRRGTCKVRAVFRGDADHGRSKDVTTFDCYVPSFGSGRAVMTSSDGVRTIDVLVAETPEQRGYGLMYRRYLPEDKGMAFLFEGDTSSGFWMKNTLIPLSIAFFDATGTILRVLDMQPCYEDPCPVYDPDVTYRGALEVNQGAFERWGVGEGDVIEVVRD